MTKMNTQESLIIIKDPHLSLGFRNKFRKPGWEKDVYSKHLFIANYCIENNISKVVSTGDVFDKQSQWSLRQYQANKKILELYKDNNIEFISIAGNHDYLEGRENIKDSAFEEYTLEGYIRYISNYNHIDTDFIRIHGIDYHHVDPTKESKEDYLQKIKDHLSVDKDKINLLVIHQNITPNKNQVTDFTYDELSEVLNEINIEVIACGHYHVGFKTEYHKNILFINPWNLWRVVRDYDVRENIHTPEFVVLSVDKDKTISYENIIIPHRSYNEAFDLKSINFYKEIKKESFDFFNKIQNLEELSFDSDDSDSNVIKKIAIEIQKDNAIKVDKNILQEAINNIINSLE